MKIKIKNPFKKKVKRTRKVTKLTRRVPHVMVIDKDVIKDTLKSIIFGQVENTGSAIGYVFDMESIVSSGGKLIGAQSTIVGNKGFTIVFYIECILTEFELQQKGDVSPTHDNLENLTNFLKKLVADQVFAIESKPNAN